jgi:hypothetical protein
MNQVASLNNNKQMLKDFAINNELKSKYNIDVEKRIVKLDIGLARHYFISEEYSYCRKILFPILFKYPHLITRSKSNIAYLLLSFMPKFIAHFLKKLKRFNGLFLSR